MDHRCEETNEAPHGIRKHVICLHVEERGVLNLRLHQIHSVEMKIHHLMDSPSNELMLLEESNQNQLLCMLDDEDIGQRLGDDDSSFFPLCFATMST